MAKSCLVSAMLLACPVLLVTLWVSPQAYAGVPELRVSASWPEQSLENNLIHKTRVPRGGVIEITAVYDPKGTFPPPPPRGYRISPPARMSLATPERLIPAKVFVDGAELPSADETVAISDITRPLEVRWQFQLPWDRSEVQEEYTFGVTVGLGRVFGSLAQSVTVEQGVSCYDTTMIDSLNRLAASPYVTMETIGTTPLGRDMYMLRVTDPSVDDAGKKPFVMVGPWHGDESAGVESTQDFVELLISDPEYSHYLQKTVVYMVPDLNPDGRSLGMRTPVSGIDINYAFREDGTEKEGVVFVEAMSRIRDELDGGIVMFTHQWGRVYCLVSHDPVTPFDYSATIARNAALALSNAMDMYCRFSSTVAKRPDPQHPRAWVHTNLDLPVILTESGLKSWTLVGLEPAIINEMIVYRTILDTLTGAGDVKPKARPPVNVTFSEDRNLKVYKVDSPPTIDGRLDDDCWVDASSVPVTRLTGEGRGQSGDTKLYACYDDEYLYLAITASDLQPASITGYDRLARLWSEDSCEIFLDTNLNQWSYFHVMANASGGFADTFYVAPKIGDNGLFEIRGYKTAGSAADGVIEMAIPFAALTGTPDSPDAPLSLPIEAGTVWGFNVVRIGGRTSSGGSIPATTWAEVADGHHPWDYNAITFMGPRE